MSKRNYWVVGATFGPDDMYPEFIDNNFWYMGWEFEHRDTNRVDQFFNRVEQINEGDRIAIKRLLGKGKNEIKIMAIGVVRKTVKGIIFVDWLMKDMDRKVPIHGCVGTIYGPFISSDEWTQQVFHI